MPEWRGLLGRRALLGCLLIVVLVGAALLIPPVRTGLLIMVGMRSSGETDIDQTCQDLSIGSGPLPGIAIPADAFRIEVGQSVQEAIDFVGADGVLVMAAGVHTGASAEPLGGQTILGEAGAILSGNGAEFAFRSAASGITIEGLVLEGYRPTERAGVIHGEEGARGWTVSGNEVRSNGEVGIVAKSEWTITSNRVHHNGRYGITGSGSGLLVQGNEIACNALELGATSESGATKFVHTNDLVLSENYVHHNLGNGLWVDINNLDPQVVANTIENNELAGIFIEISCGGLVVDNDLAGNGFGTRRPTGMHNAAIFVSTSPGVEVTQNRLIDNAKGIGALHWGHDNRQAVDKCTPELRDLSVHGNHIEQEAGLAAGIDATINGGEIWSQWGNSFFDNTYVIGPEARFNWESDTIELSEWQILGLQ